MKILLSEKGNMLVITMMVLIVATIIGVTLIGLSINGTTMNVHREHNNQAVQQAENGIQHISLLIQEELKQAILDVENEEEQRANHLHFMSELQYKSSFTNKFDQILAQYRCNSGTKIISEGSSDLHYSVCYDENHPANSPSSDTLRTVYFKSTGTAYGESETLISGVQIGATYSNYPKELNYAVATTDGGNLMMNGGITINGDVRADGNIIVSDSGYLPNLINSRRWIDSVYPSIGGSTVFPSSTGYPRFFVNSDLGHLFVVKSTTLNKGYGLLNLNKVNYKDLFKYDYQNNIRDTNIFNVTSVKEVENYLYDSDRLDLFEETSKLDSIPIAKIVEYGRQRIANEVNIYRPNNEYVTYRDKLGIPKILSGSYHATSPTLLKAGIIASLEKSPKVTGNFKVSEVGGINVALSKYTFNGNFYFHDTQANLTAGSNVTLLGNYYFDQNGLFKITPISITGGGEDTLNGNFYAEGNETLKNAMYIGGGSHQLKGNYFLDGDLVIHDTTIRTNAVFFVNGDVTIRHTTIKPLDEGKLIIFATGDIKYDYSSDNGSNVGEDYFNETQRDINAFLYANGKVELHGTVSNYKLHGGVVGNNVYLTGIRGEIGNHLLWRDFPSASEQKSQSSRLTIEYDENIVTTFNNLHNIGIEFHDLDLQPVVTVNRTIQ